MNEKLANFILDHSTNISTLDVTDVNCKWLINHHRFDVSFKNLYNLRCNFINGHEFFDKIANICRNIQSLDVCMYVDSKYLYTDQIDRSLTNLIKAQKQIEWLSIRSDKKLFFSDDFKEALLIHSKSITRYCSRGGNNIDSMLIPKFTNLNWLTLSGDDSNLAEILRSGLFRDNKRITILFFNSPLLLDLSNFIKINGKTLSSLAIYCGRLSVCEN